MNNPIITDLNIVWEVLKTNDYREYVKYNWFYRGGTYSPENAYIKIRKISWCIFRDCKKLYEVCYQIDSKSAPPWFCFNDENGQYSIVMQERQVYSIINIPLLNTLASCFKSNNTFFYHYDWLEAYEKSKIVIMRDYGLNEEQYKYLFHPDSYPNPQKVSHAEFANRIREMIKQAEKDNE